MKTEEIFLIESIENHFKNKDVLKEKDFKRYEEIAKIQYDRYINNYEKTKRDNK